MAHTWDQEALRLHRRIDVLEKENRMLRALLRDAIGITDVALAGSGRKEPSQPELALSRPPKERGT
jgi:hypothetical protein